MRGQANEERPADTSWPHEGVAGRARVGRTPPLGPLLLGAFVYAASLAVPLGAAPRGAAIALVALAAARSAGARSRIAFLVVAAAAVVAAVVAEATITSLAGAAGMALAAAVVLLPQVLPGRSRRRVVGVPPTPSANLETVLDHLEEVEGTGATIDLVHELPRLLGRFDPGGVTTWRIVPGDGLVAEASGSDAPEGDPLEADAPEADAPEAFVLRAQTHGTATHARSGRAIALPIRSDDTLAAVVEVRRSRPFPPADREAIARIVAAAERAEAILRVRRRALTRSHLGEILVQDLPRGAALEAALTTLREELAIGAVALVHHDGGVFRASAVVTDDWPELADLLQRTWPLGTGVIHEAYVAGVARFVDVYAEDPVAAPSFVDAGVRATAIRPMPLRSYAKTHLLLFDDAPRLWTAGDRALVADFARALRLWLERDREARVLERMLAVEHRLLDPGFDDATQNLLAELVDLVPGAEAGSLLVRQDDRFHYAGVVGFDRGSLAEVTLGDEHLRAWYGDRDAWTSGVARIAGDPDGMERASVVASDGRTEGQPSLRTIVANLCIPIVHRGVVIAVVNLDAFSDANAFQAEDAKVAKVFAPAIAFVLAEARHRRDLHLASTRDALTGLENRRAFDEGLAKEIARADRSETPTSLLIADLTGFKSVNDRLGHAVGDEALVSVADALRKVARDSDQLYRWGGDEFAVLLPDTDAPGALAAARRFSRAVQGVEIQGMRIGVSIGMAVRRSGGDMDADALLSQADQAMYEAKRQGIAIAEA